MKQISKLSPELVMRSVYNEDDKSLDVSLKNLEMSIELNAQDGDSVQVIKKSQLFKSEGEVTEFVIDIQMLDKVQIYSTEQVQVQVSPDGNLFFAVSYNGQPLEILGKSLKVKTQNPAEIVIVGK